LFGETNAWFHTLNTSSAFVKPNTLSVGANTHMERPKAPLGVIAEAVRRERERAGLSLTEVAKRAGIAKSTLHQLEAGTGNPSVETLWALGVALNVPFGRLVEPVAPAPRVIRAGEGPAVRSEQADYVGTLLATCPPGARRDLYLITIGEGGVRSADAHLIGSVEHVIVHSGRVRIGPVGATVELGPSDFCTFAGDVPHVYEALDTDVVLTLVMEHR
jgi:transcriptional regulator with XRE-family HTH domain